MLRPSAMGNYNMDSLAFNAINSATVTMDDEIRDSDSTENTDDDGSKNENLKNYDSKNEESEEYQGDQYVSSDTAERRMRASTTSEKYVN